MGVAAAKNKNVLYASVAAVLLFIFALVGQHSGHTQKLTSAISGAAKTLPAAWSTGSKPSEPTWHEVAIHHNTDKVNPHSYQDMYDKYLPAFRHKRIKMLEIGLGCDMVSSWNDARPRLSAPAIEAKDSYLVTNTIIHVSQGYGPGHSYYTWLDYFKDVDLYFMEYDAACAEQWANTTTGATVVTGDQGDPNVLESFIVEHGTDFDIIIDDGGHTMQQQMLSLQLLWKAIRPGGIYFCEDLETSWVPVYGGNPAVLEGAAENTMLRMIHRLVEDMTYPDESSAWPRQVYFKDVEKMVHIDCSRQVCAFEKRHM